MQESGPQTHSEDSSSEEAIRKAWEANLAKRARSRITVINSATGRKIPHSAQEAEVIYKGMHNKHTNAGNNSMSSW